MKKQDSMIAISCFLLLLINSTSCVQDNKKSADNAVTQLNLKTGDVAWCGPPQKEFGTVQFSTSCSEKVKDDFNMAMSLLHSFEYDEAEKVFAKIIKAEPDCPMAYWGVAMSNYHPLWAPPSREELVKGSKAVGIAQQLTKTSARESEYINAISMFYKDWETTDHKARTLAFEKAMEKIYLNHLEDKEAAIIYALSLTASAALTDKSFKNQRKAYRILNSMYPGQPNHPGIVHYIIHTYDFPELAEIALPAARKYASIAPSSAHAQHMPSHIFTRLGLWDENIKSNLAAISSAKCYAENTGMKGHWDEELHGMDYLMYSYLQKGDNKLAKGQWDYLKTIKEVSPINFKVAYAYAAIPARYVLENKDWKEAASMKLLPSSFPWQEYPWQMAIIHFTRAMGLAHTGDLASAKLELNTLNRLRDTLIKRGESYQANQVDIQSKSAEAWLRFKENNPIALKLMKQAADMEDATEKHPVTPGEVVPARELLGEMLNAMNKPAEALQAFEVNLKARPNRFNSLYGAAVAANKNNDEMKAKKYYDQLRQIAIPNNLERIELLNAGAAMNK